MLLDLLHQSILLALLLSPSISRLFSTRRCFFVFFLLLLFLSLSSNFVSISFFVAYSVIRVGSRHSRFSSTLTNRPPAVLRIMVYIRPRFRFCVPSPVSSTSLPLLCLGLLEPIMPNSSSASLHRRCSSGSPGRPRSLGPCVPPPQASYHWDKGHSIPSRALLIFHSRLYSRFTAAYLLNTVLYSSSNGRLLRFLLQAPISRYG